MPPSRPLVALAWTLTALFAVTGCVSAPAGHLSVSPVTAARLTLKLDGLFGRRVLYAESGPKVRVTIDGPELTSAYTTTAAVGTDGSLVTLEGVPVGGRRVITVQSLTASGLTIPSATARAVATLASGSNSVALSAVSTAAGEIATALLEHDRDKKTSLLKALDPDALTTAVEGYVRGLKVRHPALLNTEVIADAIIETGGAIPSVASTFALAPGKLVVRASDLPPGVRFTLAVDDPVSQPAGISGAEATVLEPVAPGDWTLTLAPDAPGLAAKKVGVTVAAGGTVTLNVSFAGTAAKTAMSLPVAPAGAAVATVGGQPLLVAVGGTTYSAAGGIEMFNSVATYSAAAGWASGAALSATVLDAAVASADGKVYWFGGHNGATSVGTGGVFTPGTPGAVAPIAAMPFGVAVRGASAAAIGDKIYVTGGVGDGPALEQVLTYSPASDTWAAQPIEALLPAQRNMATAVVDGRWYFFGGYKAASAWANGGLAYALMPQSKVTAFTPGPPVSWSSRQAMPTARGSAATVVVAGKVWVIGGVETLGQPSKAVEVYDPATDTWTVRSPLREGRAGPAVAYIGGKILVAGGMSGDDPFDSLPLATVEEITP